MSVAFETAVVQLVALGFARDRAEAQVRAQYPLLAPAPATAESDEAAVRVLEKREQHEIVKRLRVCGFVVYWLSQARASKQTPGLPDLWFVHRSEPIAGWFEAKRQVGGRLSPAQQEFRAHCDRTGIRHLVGDRYFAERWLVDVGLATLEAAMLVPVRPSPSRETDDSPPQRRVG